MYILGVQKAATTSVSAVLERCGLVAVGVSTHHTVKFTDPSNPCPIGAPCKETNHDPLNLKRHRDRKEFRQFYRLDNCGARRERFTWQGKRVGSPYRPNGLGVAACEDAKFLAATPDQGVMDGSLFAAIPPPLRSNARYVTILREPVSRLLSWFNHAKVLYPSALKGATSFQMYHRLQWNAWMKGKDPLNPIGRGFYTNILDKFRPNGGLGLNRYQLLVINFDHMVADPANAFKQMTTHFGLPILTHHTDLPETNGQITDNKVISIKCHTRTHAFRNYYGNLRSLYGQLQRDMNRGLAPPVEERFGKFKVEDSVHCTSNREITVGQAKRSPSLVSDLEERLRIHAIADYDEDDLLEDVVPEDVVPENVVPEDVVPEAQKPAREEEQASGADAGDGSDHGKHHGGARPNHGFEHHRNLELGGP
jgi:hypothetical protein